MDAVLVAAGFDSGVAEVGPCRGPTSVLGGNLGSLPLSKTPATTAPAVARRAIPPASTVFLLIRFGGSSGSSGLVAMLGASATGTTTGPRSAPSGSARKAPVAISAADGRSAASLASIWSRTVSNGPASSGRATTRRRRRSVDVLVKNRCRVLGRERRLTGDQLVEHATQRVHVRRLAGLPASGSLGSEVVRAADDLAGRRQRARPVAGNVSDTEIRDLDGPVRRQQQVARLHIPVDDIFAMRGGQARGGLFDDVDRTLFRQGPVLGELRGDGPAFDQLHHQEEAVAVLAEVVHRHDVRVAQPRGGSRLALESGSSARVVTGRQQQLDRDHTFQLFIGGAEDLAHAAPPESGPQSVTLRNQHSPPVPSLKTNQPISNARAYTA